MRRIRKVWVLTAATLCAVGCTQSDFRISAQQRKTWMPVENAAIDRAKEAPQPKILPETFFAAGLLHERHGDWPSALTQYRKASAVNHNFTAAFHRQGLAFSALGQHAPAVAALNRAIELEPDNPILHNNLGYTFMLQHDWPQAEREFQQAIALSPGFPRAQINLGMVLAQLERFDESLLAFGHVLPVADAHYNLGLMYRGLQRYEEAAQAFEVTLTLDPFFAAAKQQLAQIAMHLPQPGDDVLPDEDQQFAQVDEPADTPDDSPPPITQEQLGTDFDEVAWKLDQPLVDKDKMFPLQSTFDDLATSFDEATQWNAEAKDDSHLPGYQRKLNLLAEKLAVVRAEIACLEKDAGVEFGPQWAGGFLDTYVGPVCLGDPLEPFDAAPLMVLAPDVSKDGAVYGPVPEPGQETDETMAATVIEINENPSDQPSSGTNENDIPQKNAGHPLAPVLAPLPIEPSVGDDPVGATEPISNSGEPAEKPVEPTSRVDEPAEKPIEPVSKADAPAEKPVQPATAPSDESDDTEAEEIPASDPPITDVWHNTGDPMPALDGVEAILSIVENDITCLRLYEERETLAATVVEVDSSPAEPAIESSAGPEAKTYDATYRPGFLVPARTHAHRLSEMPN